MSETPFSRADALRIGTVDFVSPDELKVLLDIEAPDAVALNAGGARPFPRVNSYLLIPVDDGYLVGQIEWLTIERSAFPKRRGVQDFGLIDLPYPLRKLRLNPLGTLRKDLGDIDRYIFRRGADALPSVGASVLLPTETQLRSIVESGPRRRVRIGASPLAGNAEVAIDPDRLFGRHLAVLGNTGSGKSCSVAGIIRWSLEQARSQHVSGGRPNARFIVLDPNGEYSRAFAATDQEITSRVFKVGGEAPDLALKVPLWFWNSSEWSSFTQASAKTQRPLLRRALREVKAGRSGADLSAEESKLQLRRYLSSVLISLRREIATGAIRTEESKVGYRLKAILEDLRVKAAAHPESSLNDCIEAVRSAHDHAYHTFSKGAEVVEYYRAFSEKQLEDVVGSLSIAVSELGGLIYQEGPDEDVPVPFKGADLADHLQMLGEQEGVSQFTDFLVSRIRTFLSDSRIRAVVADDALTIEGWLSQYVGEDQAAGGEIAILDLSLVPSEVVHVVTAVAARMIFEALQRYRRLHGVTLPTVLVMEEAHAFIKRYRDDAEEYDAARVCAQTFERIAREGRKFGLGLVLSSQRPSELSATVLSQCNSFLLHRISNDRDQELVQRLVPDNLRGLLRELPSLPAQHAILLGWATEVPVLVRMDELPKHLQPRSDDPDFWNVWTARDDAGIELYRPVEWKAVAEDWVTRQSGTAPADTVENSAEELDVPGQFSGEWTEDARFEPDDDDDDVDF